MNKYSVKQYQGPMHLDLVLGRITEIKVFVMYITEV